jgi:hypothetical protein
MRANTPRPGGSSSLIILLSYWAFDVFNMKTEKELSSPKLQGPCLGCASRAFCEAIRALNEPRPVIICGIQFAIPKMSPLARKLAVDLILGSSNSCASIPPQNGHGYISDNEWPITFLVIIILPFLRNGDHPVLTTQPVAPRPV